MSHVDTSIVIGWTHFIEGFELDKVDGGGIESRS